MGILNVFKSKKQVEKQSEVSIDFSGFYDWFEKQFSGDIDKANSEIKKLSKNILESLPEIKKSIQKLEKPKIEEKHREDSIINSLKDSYVKRSLSICDKFPSNLAQDFGEKVKDILNELNNPNPKEIYVVSTYFQKESKDLVESIKRSQQLLKNLNDFVSGNGKIIKIKEEIEKLANLCSEKIEENKVLEAEILGKEKKTGELTEKIERLKKDIEYLRNSDKAKRNIELGWEIELCEKDATNIEAFIKEQLSCLKRPIEKLGHEVDLINEEKKSVESLGKSPFSFFIENQNEFLTIFNLVKDKLHVLKLKEADAEKVKKLEVEKLLELKKEYLEKISQKQTAEKNLEESDLKTEIEEMELESGNTVKYIEVHLKEIQDSKNKIASNKNEITKTKETTKNSVFEKLNIKLEFKEEG